MKVSNKIGIDIEKMAKELDKMKVQVGFLSSAKYEDGTRVAQVAMSNEYGVPQKRQPPRPFMRQALKKSGEWKKTFDFMAQKDFSRGGDFKTSFDTLGSVVKGDIQISIKELTSPALAQSTIDQKGFSKPLIGKDSGYMLDSVNYEVSK
tara:strand:- start:26923 stop:27369 length:447 start_codon:yes stop_codon:yes gene_type:complete